MRVILYLVVLAALVSFCLPAKGTPENFGLKRIEPNCADLSKIKKFLDEKKSEHQHILMRCTFSPESDPIACGYSVMILNTIEAAMDQTTYRQNKECPRI